MSRFLNQRKGGLFVSEEKEEELENTYPVTDQADGCQWQEAGLRRDQTTKIWRREIPESR